MTDTKREIYEVAREQLIKDAEMLAERIENMNTEVYTKFNGKLKLALAKLARVSYQQAERLNINNLKQ